MTVTDVSRSGRGREGAGAPRRSSPASTGPHGRVPSTRAASIATRSLEPAARVPPPTARLRAEKGRCDFSTPVAPRGRLGARRAGWRARGLTERGDTGRGEPWGRGPPVAEWVGTSAEAGAGQKGGASGGGATAETGSKGPEVRPRSQLSWGSGQAGRAPGGGPKKGSLEISLGQKGSSGNSRSRDETMSPRRRRPDPQGLRRETHFYTGLDQSLVDLRTW